jgi:hypothetical protein
MMLCPSVRIWGSFERFDILGKGGLFLILYCSNRIIPFMRTRKHVVSRELWVGMLIFDGFRRWSQDSSFATLPAPPPHSFQATPLSRLHLHFTSTSPLLLYHQYPILLAFFYLPSVIHTHSSTTPPTQHVRHPRPGPRPSRPSRL